MKRYGQIIIDNRASQVDRPFTYIIEEELIDLIQVGMRVVVPFGIGNKLTKGFVIGINKEFHGDYKLKKVVDVLDHKPLVTEGLLNLGLWMKDYYLASYMDVLQPILPPGNFKEVNTIVEIINEENLETNIEEEKQIIDYLLRKERILLSQLKTDLKIPYINRHLDNLRDREIIDIILDIRTTVQKKTEPWVSIVNKDKDLEELESIIGRRSYKQIEIIRYIYNSEKDLSIREILLQLNTTLSTVRALEKKGLIKIYDREILRQPVTRHISSYKKHSLNFEQEKVYSRIKDSLIGKTRDNKFLIHGVTGSGKTEIYLQLVEKALEQGKDSIILVPEISLTPQTIDRFMGRFGDEVAVLHSRLSHGERFDQWRMIKEGKVKIVVGARSAVFAPFNNLGLIIIDEEHETTYKSSQNPKYDTIEVASKRVELEEGILVMGSATPSLESYYKSLEGEIILLELKDRVKDYGLPEVEIVDMRTELEQGNRSIFSQQLYEAIKNNLLEKNQTILFLNRRGFSTFISCRKCGYVVKCNSCDISMTYHRHINKVKCHYCGKILNPPNLCPECKSDYIKYFGIGTEKVEEITREFFPQAKIARMDLDTTGFKGSYEKILGDMKNKKIDILIGTQMISKGLDFQDVTLVGIIAADTTLNLPDFRSPERAFQLITQVAGRAGRGEYGGKVILQTYEPEHYSIQYAKNHDYINYYKTEIPLRKEFLYPPFINLISILVFGENNLRVESVINQVYNIIKRPIYEIYGENGDRYISGPYPAPLEKIKNNYRWQILIKAELDDMDRLKRLIKRVCIDNEDKINIDGVKFSIDINPSSII